MDKQIKLIHKLIIDLVEDARLHKGTPMASIIGNGNFVAEQIINSVYNQTLKEIDEIFMDRFDCDGIRSDWTNADIRETIHFELEQLKK